MECDLAIGPFTFLHVYETLACRECAFAVLVNEVFTHLAKRHRAITAAERCHLVKRAAELQNAKRTQVDLQAFCFPPPTIECVPYLSPPKKDGLKCIKCPHIARQIQKIQEHCKTKHKWENTQRPGRPELKRKITPQNELGNKHEVLWREGVSCQRFFPSRCASGWFKVGRKAICQKNVSMHNTRTPQDRQIARDTGIPQPQRLLWKNIWKPHSVATSNISTHNTRRACMQRRWETGLSQSSHHG